MVLIFAWMVLTQGIPAWFVVLLTVYYGADLYVSHKYVKRVDALWAERRDKGA